MAVSDSQAWSGMIGIIKFTIESSNIYIKQLISYKICMCVYILYKQCTNTVNCQCSVDFIVERHMQIEINGTVEFIISYNLANF